MEFSILGPLEVRREGESLALGGAKQRSLLAILLLNANRVVSSDRLIDELWGADAPETAAKALQVHVSQLRKALEPDREVGRSGRVVLTRSPGYLIEVDADQLDLARFERLVAEGRRTLAEGNPELAARTLRDALALWRGPPLAELAYADFVQREAPRLEELRLAALEERIEADLESGRHSELIGELERLIAEEPLRERPRCQLMLALYRAGRQAEALDAYREAREALVEQLGIEPGRALKGLEAAILAQDPALEAPPQRRAKPEAEPSQTQGALPRAVEERRVQSRFVGRESELRDLEVALEAALLGRGTVFLVGGAPGIGKSRLVDELGRRAADLEAVVVWGRCWEAGGAPAYWPWVQALRSYLRAIDPDRLRRQVGAHGAEIARILPELREVLPDLPVLELPESEGARFRLFDAGSSFLKRAASDRSIVIVLEDLHAADVPSLLLLEFLAGEIADAPLLVIGTYRDIELGPDHPLTSAVLELGRHPATRTLLLEGFQEADVSRLVETIAGVSPSSRVAAAIHAGTGGNPLFISELVRLLASEGRLEEPIDEAGVRLSIPRGVRDVIDRRLAQVSDESRELLSIASVFGREFAVETLSQITGAPVERALHVLDEGIGEGILSEVAGASYRCRFSHALLRDSLYDELGASRRMQLHREIGDALEGIYADDPDPHLAELAHHFSEAGPSGDARKAYDYARRAGDRAATLLAYEEAVRLYELAARLLESTVSAAGPERCDTLLALGTAQLRAGDEVAAKETFLEAAELARLLEDPDALARAALGYGVQYWLAARGDRKLIPLLEEALASLDEGDSALRARLMARLACAIRDQPSRDRRIRLSEEAQEMAERVGDAATQAYAVAARCIALLDPNHLHTFGETAGRAVELGQRSGDTEAELTGHWWRVYFHVEVGNTRMAHQELSTATRLAEELKEPGYRWYPAGLEAGLAVFEGRFDDAAELIPRAYELGRGALRFNATVSYRLQMFALHRERGLPPYRPDALTSLIAEYETYTILRCALAALLLEEGRDADARATFEDLAQQEFGGLYLDEEWLASMTLLADACGALGDRERASILYRQLLPFALLNAHAFPEMILGSVERPLGVLAALGGDWGTAEGHFTRAIEVNARMGGRPWVAHARHDFARALINKARPRDRRRASELLADALDTYRELAMTPWERRAEADRRRLEEAPEAR